MSAVFNLSELSQVEKLQLLEQLWAELEHSELISPAWHGDVLQDTQKLVATQQAELVDWQEAKNTFASKNNSYAHSYINGFVIPAQAGIQCCIRSIRLHE